MKNPLSGSRGKAKEHYYCSVVISELQPEFLRIHVGKLEYIHCVSVTVQTLQQISEFLSPNIRSP